MAMSYEELDQITRQHMLAELQSEQGTANAYRSKALSQQGLATFPDLLRSAITSGNEVSLTQAISDAALWNPDEEYTRNGVTRIRQRNIEHSSQRLALAEFSTWYVRGLAKRLLEEGVSNCQIYRGEQPKWEPGECAHHEGLIISVQQIYNNHRVRYWPEPGDQNALSIPYSPGCHHVIRRSL